METYSPYSIASYFLHKAAESNQTLTPMKVIKLVYLAHAWNLGLFGNPLFEEKAQAWKYGPVIPSLYHALKFFGNEDVPKDAMAPTSPITDARMDMVSK